MQLLTQSDVCGRLKVSRATLWRFRNRYSDFPKPVTFNGIHLRWVDDEVDAWVVNHKQDCSGVSQ